MAGRVAGQGNLPSLGVQGMLLEGDFCLTVPIWRQHEAAVLFIRPRVPVCWEEVSTQVQLARCLELLSWFPSVSSLSSNPLATATMHLPAVLGVGLLALLTPASATRPRLVPPVVPLPPAAAARISNSTGNFTFKQLLDHDLPFLGTFGQRVWWNAEHWGGPGSPIILFTPGESAADGYGGYLTNATLTGKMAQEVKGAVVMVERAFPIVSLPPIEQL